MFIHPDDTLPAFEHLKTRLFIRSLLHLYSPSMLPEDYAPPLHCQPVEAYNSYTLVLVWLDSASSIRLCSAKMPSDLCSASLHMRCSKTAFHHHDRWQQVT